MHYGRTQIALHFALLLPWRLREIGEITCKPHFVFCKTAALCSVVYFCAVLSSVSDQLYIMVAHLKKQEGFAWDVSETTTHYNLPADWKVQLSFTVLTDKPKGCQNNKYISI